MTSKFLGNMLMLSVFFYAIGSFGSVAEAYRSNKYVDKGGCYLQKEYNYFMNQWTTNEVCKPKFVEVPVKEESVNNNYNVSNSYLYYDERPPQVTYYNGPSLDALHTAKSSGNSWGGFGSASNYLLGSFGGGHYNSYAAPTYIAPTTYYSSWFPSYSNYGYFDTMYVGAA
jgi:hypothetical protein